jgi:hypothetical protein
MGIPTITERPEIMRAGSGYRDRWFTDS